MGVKSFIEGVIASIVAGCRTHSLDLIKVRMQLQGEQVSVSVNSHNIHNLRPAFALPTQSPPVDASSLLGIAACGSKAGPLSISVYILHFEGASALFSGVLATMLHHTLFHHSYGSLRCAQGQMDRPDKRNLPMGFAVSCAAYKAAMYPPYWLTVLMSRRF
ncbi:mitochondrial uncoupling protein 4-like [Neltuma alba]|uniref:mitochondrial uncoupling protein 4-like n=1 Tax=Neltuma alba TaxID=207710 RepID=UPI0010A2EC5F|nr:mitochondrial uncoupling protein 4-like [Prosopis alba]